MFDQGVGGFPGLLLGFTDNHVQTNAKAYGAAQTVRAFTHIGDFFGHGRRRFAPGQVHVYLLCGQVVSGVGRTAEIQRRIGFLHRWVQRLGVLYVQVLAFKVDGLTLQHPAPDFQKLIRHFVAFAVAEETAVTAVFIRVAAGHHVNQQAPAGQPVQGGRHARRHGRRDDPRANRHQITQALGQRHQCRGDDPRVFAGAPGRDQNTVVAQVISRLGDLFEVIERDRASTFGGAQKVAVAVGGEEPKHIHEEVLKRFSAKVWPRRQTAARHVLQQGGYEPARAR